MQRTVTSTQKYKNEQTSTKKYINTSKYIIYTIIKKLTYWYTLQAHGSQRDEGA
jgi:hypothetical protein